MSFIFGVGHKAIRLKGQLDSTAVGLMWSCITPDSKFSKESPYVLLFYIFLVFNTKNKQTKKLESNLKAQYLVVMDARTCKTVR